MKLIRRSDGVLRAEIITDQIAPEKMLADAFEYEGRFRRYLSAAGAYNRIDVVINSGGGNTDSAWGLLYALYSVPQPKRVLIDGTCGSAATILACGMETPVYITETSRYYIHMVTREVLVRKKGVWSAIRKKATRQDPLTFAALYRMKTGKSRETILAWMKKGTWFEAQEAVEAGFCDGIMSREEFDNGGIQRGKSKAEGHSQRNQDHSHGETGETGDQRGEQRNPRKLSTRERFRIQTKLPETD